MSMYIVSLRDKETGATLLPRSVFQGLSDINGNTIDPALLASDINVLVDGKIDAMDNIIGELSEKIPDAPNIDGNYTLKASVNSGVITYSWVSE